MDSESYDVLVVGGGLAGLRAAIAAVEANPRVKVGMVFYNCRAVSQRATWS